MGEYLHEQTAFREWLTPGGSGYFNGRTVSEEAVTRVTLASLFVTWNVTARHGARHGNSDAFLPFIDLEGIDKLCGVPHFGEAMSLVGVAHRVR